MLKNIVKAVEDFNDEYFKGKQKKETALNLLDEAYVLAEIDIPFVPNSWERRIVRWIAGMFIDIIVGEFNEKGWK